MPIMSIYKLPHGQYGYCGHVINFPQDVKSFATSLPRLPSQIDVLVVRQEKEQTHRDFHVRRRVVEEALTWLLANNVYYQTIGISLNENALASLPVDGDITDLPSMHPTESPAELITSDDTTTTEEYYSSSFVPNAAPPATERETIQRAVQGLGDSRSRSSTLIIIGGTPINEFHTEGYFSMAFPYTLPNRCC